MAKAADAGITFLSSAWDEDSVDILDRLGMAAFKIGSADITSLPLIRHIARKGKPIILSTGASTIGDIEVAIRAIHDEGLYDIVLLHCILSYPTQYSDANLQMMVRLIFLDIPVGYSDHTLADHNMTVPLAAAALGARVIEKHHTMDKSMLGNDHYLSMDPADLEQWTASLKILYEAQGKDGPRTPLPSRGAGGGHGASQPCLTSRHSRWDGDHAGYADLQATRHRHLASALGNGSGPPSSC